MNAGSSPGTAAIDNRDLKQHDAAPGKFVTGDPDLKR